MKGEQESSRQRSQMSRQMKQKIKKKPFFESIDNIQFTYALLKKKNQNFFLTNQRLLILRGTESIGYARQLPQKTLLPFQSIEAIPKLKDSASIINIQSALTSGDELVINFKPETKKDRWQFVCESAEIAKEWKNIIKQAYDTNRLSSSNVPIELNIPEQPHRSSTLPPALANRNTHILEEMSPTRTSQVPKGQPSRVGPSDQGDPFTLEPLPSNQGETKNNPITQNSPNDIAYRGSTIPTSSGFNPNSRISLPQQLPANPSNPNLSSPNQSSLNPKNSALATISEQPDQQARLSAANQGRQSINPLQGLGIINPSPVVVDSGLPQTNQANPPSALNAKEEYLRRKKEQEQKRNILVETNPLNASTISVRSVREQAQEMATNWDYEFIKGQAEYLLVERFKRYVQGVVVRLIDEIGLGETKRHYKPVRQTLSEVVYEIGGVQFILGILELSQTSHFHDRTSIVSPQNNKQLRQQFKNSNYILQVTNNRGRFRVPLMQLTQYKGFTVLAKSMVHSSTDYSSLSAQLQQDIGQLERDARISRSIFEEEQNLKVLAADQKYFEKLARAENKPKKFDMCFLIDVYHFLPQDFYGIGRENSPNFYLRSELVSEDEYQGLMLSGGNISGAANRVKVSNQTRNAVSTLTQISRSIPERVLILLKALQNADQVITNSAQLSELMHRDGINMRYLGLMLDNCKEPWLQGMLTSEVIARSAKYFLRYDLQDGLLNLAADKPQQVAQYQVGQVLGWLNRVFGIGAQSQTLWGQIYRQAQTHFKCSFSKGSINIGFLIQALQHHGGFKLNRVTFNEPFFKSNNIFTRQHFFEFAIDSQVYDLSFTDHYSILSARLQDPSPHSYEQLQSILNLDRKDDLDSHYSMGTMRHELISYLINWMSPQQAGYLYNVEKLRVPCRLFYDIQLTAIKWELKAGRVHEAEKVRDFVVDHIGRWLGECHPILSELYDIFARYYGGLRDEEKQAVTYCRSSLKNQQKLLGGQHIKLAEGYYTLGGIQLNFNKTADSLQAYKKAAGIMSQNNDNSSQPYAQIIIKMGELYLVNGLIKEASDVAREGLRLSQNLSNSALYLASAQLLGRSYEVGQRWQDYIGLVNDLAVVSIQFRDQPQKLQRIIKTMLTPALYSASTRGKQPLVKLLNWLPELKQITATSHTAYLFLRSLMEQRMFPNVFLDYMDGLEEVVREIESSGVVGRWKGFQQMWSKARSRPVQLLCMLQVLQVFLSGNFVEGILRERT